ncbi:competence type IV pilus ATPase ComGA [Limosilactobacillus caccae]|uniref:competence type IV pilus ATPase ComGA n=1 Tax=Limosilactobacillus caccae TaxID=1926284 RepID=UPI0009704422|nr:competence type IV pilus ATPase ComGA [Limosilactobacillus caccae]
MQQFEKELATVIAKRASDLYILPINDYYQLRLAIVGKEAVLKEVSAEYGERLISFLKYRADMAVSEHRRPQLGAITWDRGAEKVNIRLSSVGDYQGRESMVVRFIYQLGNDGFNVLVPQQWTQLQQIVLQRGLMLFAGPMGVGKTTTMYRLARSLLPQKVVLSIEDPVEIDEPSFIQLQVNELAGMDYQSLLRLGLRHRPDVFIIGEIRDPQTALMTIQAALSGHLVLGTIHAQNVYGVIARLEQLGVDRYYLQQALTGICYQRLLPTVNGSQAVLWDLLFHQQLAAAINEQKGGQMTDDWQKNLEKAVANKQLTTATAQKYANG